ncbi:hypothetical protein JCM33374_g49 [Metschnikowia sp. JCM 33374]|nr:hypothetical protein JCM33374_g49 [Metschnikowia sp. JCM 33374]
MANTGSSKGGMFGWFKRGKTKSQVRKLQKLYGLSKEMAKIVHANTFTNSTYGRRDLACSALATLILAGALAAEAHKRWMAQINKMAIDSVYSMMDESDNEEDLLNIIENLEVSDLLGAAENTLYPMDSTQVTFPSKCKYMKSHTYDILRDLRKYHYWFVPGNKINVGLTGREFFQEDRRKVHHNLTMSLSFDKQDLGEFLADHLDDSWQANWTKNRASRPKKATSVNAIFGVALINSVFALTMSLLEGKRIRYPSEVLPHYEMKNRFRDELPDHPFPKFADLPLSEQPEFVGLRSRKRRECYQYCQDCPYCQIIRDAKPTYVYGITI